ncbi:sugar transferase [Clostridium sp. Ade.TY]|uniref:sugar transferase n=1 Tax=Clostridium sp. Ade.TY TaxID=1391647 RepID=UPI00041A8252|nr:sugar transferase [Clostridium sp. Ade.TY]
MESSNRGNIPQFMNCKEVNIAYDQLLKKRKSLIIKRAFDLIIGIIGLVVLLPIMILIALIIKMDSKGPCIFKQVRITKYGEKFFIYKFRTMIIDAEKFGSQVTTENDPRITRVGKILRKYRLDELPQILNIVRGDLSFVGTRPEVPKYVEKYTKEMLITLLMPGGVTSLASIKFKDEEKLLSNSENVDKVYVEEILPLKMKYNLKYIENFTFINDIKIIIKTLSIFVNRGNKGIV